MASPFPYFLVALLVCFVGTLPFGPINLTVVKTTVDHDKSKGMAIALAGSLVEIIEALIAISFGMFISNFLNDNTALKLFIGIVFIGLAVYVFTRDSDPALRSGNGRQSSFFVRGLFLAALNPQAIPFWIFALATISQYVAFEYSGINLLAFLGGVFVGKILALYCFVVMSAYLKAHLKQSSKLVNRVLSAILLLIGVSQLINAA